MTDNNTFGIPYARAGTDEDGYYVECPGTEATPCEARFYGTWDEPEMNTEDSVTKLAAMCFAEHWVRYHAASTSGLLLENEAAEAKLPYHGQRIRHLHAPYPEGVVLSTTYEDCTSKPITAVTDKGHRFYAHADQWEPVATSVRVAVAVELEVANVPGRDPIALAEEAVRGGVSMVDATVRRIEVHPDPDVLFGGEDDDAAVRMTAADVANELHRLPEHRADLPLLVWIDPDFTHEFYEVTAVEANDEEPCAMLALMPFDNRSI